MTGLLTGLVPRESAPSAEGSNTLGSNGKSVHTASAKGESVHVNRPKRKAQPPRDMGQVIDGLAKRRRRFELTRLAGSVLHVAGKHWKDQHATVWCHRGSSAGEGETLPVVRKGDGTGARLEGVITCGHGWTCPVCAATIAEKRRQELTLATERHCSAGGTVYLLTLTVPHQADQQLAQLLDQLLDARKRLQNCRKWKSTWEQAGRVGSVAGLEVTVGFNGWHPHVHMLVYANRRGLGEAAPNEDGDLSSGQIDTLKLEWVRILSKLGIVNQAQASDVYRHGLNVRGGDRASEYIAKYGDDHWGLSREMAATYAKIGIRGMQGGWQHFTPFQLLEIADCDKEYSPQARAMFIEFAAAFKGRRMLTWSPGLKAHFNIAELDDADITAELGQPAKPEEFVAAQITQGQFSALTRTNALGAFLEYVAHECADMLIAQDLCDSWIERVTAERAQRHRRSGRVLQRVQLHSYAPIRYQYEEIEA